MFTNNNSEWNLEMEVPFFPPDPFFPTFEEVQLLIFGSILIKYESKHFHMLTINKYDYLQATIWKERKEKFVSYNVLDLV